MKKAERSNQKKPRAMAKRSVQRVYPLETGPFRPSFFRSLLSDICRLCIYRSYDSFSSLHASIVARRCKYRLDRFRVYNARVCVCAHTKECMCPFKSCSLIFERITFSQDPPHSFIATRRNRFEAISRVLISRWLP